MSELLKRLGFFDRFWCRLKGHRPRDAAALGSVMASSGPRFLYQCRRCGDYFSEKW